MADKQLAESDWKAFAKGKYKDAALLKALAALDKAGKADADTREEALDDIGKQADLLRKANKADKDLTARLDSIDKALAKERAAVKAERAKAEADAGEEEESPALLTTKMVPLLRQVRKGDRMQVLIAIAGKDTAVLMSRRSISPSRNKLLKEYLDASGAVRYIKGECLFEEKAHTFVVMTQAAGLAKKMRAALLAQTQLRLKVRVRGEDPNDLDEDGEDAGDEADDGVGAAAAAAADAAAVPAEPPTAPPAPPAPPTPAETWARRLALVQPRVDRALAAKTPNGAKLQALLAFANGKAAGGDHIAGVQALGAVEKLLDQPAPAATADAGASAASEGSVDPAAAFNARLAALMPKVRDAIAGGEPRANAVKLTASEAGAKAKAKDYPAAQALLDTLEDLLAGRPATAAPAGAPTAPTAPAAERASATDDAKAQHDALVAQLQGGFDAANKPGVPVEFAEPLAALRRAWDMAAEAAAGDNHARAVVILRRIADGGLLDRIAQARIDGAGAAKPSGLVAQRKFMLTRWAQIPTQLQAELQVLKETLELEGADDDPEELANAIDAELQTLLSGLQDQLDAAVTSGNRDAFSGLRQRVEQDSTIGLLLRAPFMDGKSFRQATLDALNDIEAAMAD